MAARALMLAGTGSDVGKSLIVAGLCRYFHRRGLIVRPFKPQNMSNNAAVTADGGEIGRAQALQARAAGVTPSVHMNPVLLKPQSETSAQVIVQGRMAGKIEADRYIDMKAALMTPVLDSFRRLASEADLVIVEGAGAISEINLRTNDIANLGFAREARVPAVVVGDIERGGVIASLAGTRNVLPDDDAAMVRGFLVNKFRGDPALFEDGMAEIERLTGWPALGLIPYFRDASRLPAEDALALDDVASAPRGKPLIAVLAYPHISNFDDFDPLRLEPGAGVVFLRPGEVLPAQAQLVILPGSKATLADLAVVRETGWDIDLSAHIRRGGHVLGICGGYQMLGTSIADPDGIEGNPATAAGLGYLDVTTALTGTKALRHVSGETVADGAAFNGYEMHIGLTEGRGTARPLLRFADGQHDGAVSADGRVSGCYVHGFFGAEEQRAAWLARIGGASSGFDYEADVDTTLDRLAGHIAAHVDCDRLLALAATPGV